jgi:hypothetical protein
LRIQEKRRFWPKKALLTTGLVEEESDESGYWLEVDRDVALAPTAAVDSLLKEAGELTAIFARSTITARQSINCQSINRQSINRQSTIANKSPINNHQFESIRLRSASRSTAAPRR